MSRAVGADAPRPRPPRRPLLPRLRPPRRLGPRAADPAGVGRPAAPPVRPADRRVGAGVADPQRPAELDDDRRRPPGVPAVPRRRRAARAASRSPCSTTASRPCRPMPRRSPATTGWRPPRGRCQVVVHTAATSSGPADLSAAELVAVTAVLRERTAALWRAGPHLRDGVREPRRAVGATLPHQHGQLYALDHLPPVTATKRDQLGRHRARTATCLGLHDRRRGPRQRAGAGRRASASWSAVPFAPRWPYEVHMTARDHGIGRLGELDDAAVLELARPLAGVVDRYDGAVGLRRCRTCCASRRRRPVADGRPEADWHLHVELLPPHRSAERLKVRASVETALGMFINDTVPERTAAELRRRAGALERSWADVIRPDDRGRRVTTVVAMRTGSGQPDRRPHRPHRRVLLPDGHRARRHRAGDRWRRAGPAAQRRPRTGSPTSPSTSPTPRTAEPPWAATSPAWSRSCGRGRHRRRRHLDVAGRRRAVVERRARGRGRPGPRRRRRPTQRRLARRCQAAEHAARGVPTGILDQLASIGGRPGAGCCSTARR